MAGRIKIIPARPTTQNVLFTSGKVKGFNCGGYRTAQRLTTLADFTRIKAYGANALRVFVTLTETPAASFNYVLASADETYLDSFIEFSRQAGLYVIPVFELDNSKGAGSNHWGNTTATSSLVAALSYLAKKYKDNKTIIAFDLMNEPVITGVYTDLTWHALAYQLTADIRLADPNRTVVFETTNYADSLKFTNLMLLPFDNVVYSFHSYGPHGFTHQGVSGLPVLASSPPATDSYPGFDDTYNPPWNTATHSAYHNNIKTFKTTYNVPIYVGEFSVVIYANPTARYNLLKDKLDLFNSEGWNWTYHSQGDWVGWDFRRQDVGKTGTDIAVPDSTYEKLLIEAFK